MDLSAPGLKKLVDFPVKGECRRIVPPSHEYVVHEIRSRLGHEKHDKQSAKMFREGWMAIVGIVRSDFMAKQAASRRNPLLLEARNAFTDTRAEWDSEKGELVGQLHEKKKLNSFKEETMQTQLTQLREMMEAATKRFDESPELKRELEAKRQELKRLQENDRKIRHRLRAAKKKEMDLETELKKMPAGVVLKGESKTLKLMKSGKKWHISCYPQLFNASDYTQWKSPVKTASDLLFL
ncbi:hypothetical protein R1sor_021595 [Riccia sorocarpa]|uniref:Uncharacterized protein n=1 Tax=Riccia sorocarpa TaxID=122646 RepID=A0ABD3GLQ8_9MARC